MDCIYFGPVLIKVHYFYNDYQTSYNFYTNHSRSHQNIVSNPGHGYERENPYTINHSFKFKLHYFNDLFVVTYTCTLLFLLQIRSECDITDCLSLFMKVEVLEGDESPVS